MKFIYFSLSLFLIFFVPLSFIVRMVGSIFSERLRRQIAAHPVWNFIWFLSAAAFFYFATGTNIHSSSREATFYHSAKGNAYWNTILNGLGKEIARKDGIIFYYFPGRHGPSVHSILEETAENSRQEFLRTLTDRIIFVYDERQHEPLQRVKLLTGHEEPDIDALGRWWQVAGKDFEFDSGVIERYRRYWIEKDGDRVNRHAAFEQSEREKILRGEYRSKLKH